MTEARGGQGETIGQNRARRRKRGLSASRKGCAEREPGGSKIGKKRAVTSRAIQRDGQDKEEFKQRGDMLDRREYASSEGSRSPDDAVTQGGCCGKNSPRCIVEARPEADAKGEEGESGSHALPREIKKKRDLKIGEVESLRAHQTSKMAGKSDRGRKPITRSIVIWGARKLNHIHHQWRRRSRRGRKLNGGGRGT